MASIPDDKKVEHAQTYAEIHVGKSYLVLEMIYRDVIKMRAKCNKPKLEELYERLYEISITSAILDDLGITNKRFWAVGSRKKPDRILQPMLWVPKDTPLSKLRLVKKTASELFADPEFQAYAKEIQESALTFFRDNLPQEIHFALDTLLWECQLLAMQEAAGKRGYPTSLPRKIAKRVKDQRVRISKKRFNLRRGRRSNSLTRSPEALIRKQQRAAEAIKQRKVILLEAARLLLENQALGMPGNELNVTNLAAKLSKSRQTISRWMENCGYDLERLESEAVSSIRRQMNK